MKPLARMTAAGFILGAAQGLGEIVRACSLTCNVGFRALPLAFVAVSIFSVLFVAARRRWVARLGPRGWEVSSILATAASLLIFRLAAYMAVEHQWVNAARWIYLGFYVWFTIVFSALVSDLLIRVSRACEGQAAARGIVYVSASILSGGLAGSLSAGAINAWLERVVGGRFEMLRDHMMLGMALILLLNIPLSRTPSESDDPLPEPRPAINLKEGLNWMRSSRAVAGLALLCFTGGCAAIISDYIFYWLIAERMPGGNGLVSYFSGFYVWLHGFSLFVMAFGVERIVRKAGLAVALALLPISLFLGAAFLLFHLTVLVMYIFRIAEEGLWEALYEPVKESLFLSVDRSRYDALRSLVDTLVYRLGQAFAALAVLFLGSGLKVSLPIMVGVLLVVYVAWIAAVANAARQASELTRP